MLATAIEARLRELPEEKQQEVLDYIDFLSRRYKQPSEKPGFSFSWAGGLADLKETFTAVELQHKARD